MATSQLYICMQVTYTNSQTSQPLTDQLIFNTHYGFKQITPKLIYADISYRPFQYQIPRLV